MDISQKDGSVGIERSLRKYVKDLVPYAPGSFCVTERAVRISANENNFGTCPEVVDAIRCFLEGGEGLCRYPDITCTELRAALSKVHGLPPESFVVTNGLDDMITILAMTFINEGDEIIVPAVTFGIYAKTCAMLGARAVEVPMTDALDIDIDGMIAAITERTKLIWLCSPNNPTGASVPTDRFEDLLRATEKFDPAPIILLDHAYADFSDRASDVDGINYVGRARNVIVLRTMSKVSGLAGIRVGYAAADPEIISCIYKVRPPYTVNALAQTAALAYVVLPEAEEHKSRSVRSIRRSRSELERFLKETGTAFVPSSANFVFAFYDRTEDEIKEISRRLAEDEIYVRTLIHAGAPSGLRISIGRPEENERLISCLKGILGINT